MTFENSFDRAFLFAMKLWLLVVALGIYSRAAGDLRSSCASEFLACSNHLEPEHLSSFCTLGLYIVGI